MLRRGRKSGGESKAVWPYGGVVRYHLVENLPSCGRMILKENSEESPYRCVGACLVLCKRFHPQVSGSNLNQRVDCLFWSSVVDSRVDWLESLEEQDCAGSVHMCWKTLHQQQSGPKATASCSGVAVISEYCKGNSSAVEYPLGQKLVGLHIEDVSFATDQTERHLEVGNTGYGNYDSSTKRRLLVSLGIFLRIYYKGGMLGPSLGTRMRPEVTVIVLLYQRATLMIRNAVVGQRRMVDRIWQDAITVGTKLEKLLSIEYASRRPYVVHGHMGKLAKSGSTEMENIDEDVHCE
ncbi:hypothetical protein Adt_35402 [Abeliophyllum distichum]|uniref:Uncharacterized protein n=1 Tax=Abeliophyllum distichum TaxID=126358 RepID=A0ABD1QEM1_9LAMI